MSLIQSVIDADTHFWQPYALWKEYVDPKYQDSIAETIEKAGLDPKQAIGSGAGAVGKDDRLIAATTPLFDKAAKLPADDPIARLKFMDSEGITASVIYPGTMTYLCYVEDPDVASAASRAMNTWSAAFAATAPQRLLPCMVLPWYHPERALEEFHVARELGLTVAFSTPAPSPDRRWSDPALDPLWAAMEEAGAVMTFHEFTRQDARLPRVARPSYSDNFALMYLCAHTVEALLGLSDVVLGGVLDRFPRLRIGLVEAHAAWLPGWLDMMDTVSDRKVFNDTRKGGGDPTKGRPEHGERLLPSELFRRQGFIVAFPEDRSLDVVIERIGPEVLMLSTDYPHPNATYDLVDQFATNYPDVSDEVRQQVLGENGARIFGLDTQSK